jgi:hypothetical protein
MIGDGMGENIIQATQEKYKDQLYKNQLAMNYLTKVGTHNTYSAVIRLQIRQQEEPPLPQVRRHLIIRLV